MQVVAVVLGWLSRVAELARVSLQQTLTDVGLSTESPDPSRETKSTHIGGGVWYESVIETHSRLWHCVVVEIDRWPQLARVMVQYPVL